MLEFFGKLFAAQNKAASEYFCITAKRASGSGWRERFVSNLAEVRAVLNELPEDQYNLYFCPTPFRRRRRVKDSVSGSTLLWADLDEVKPQSIPDELRPTWAWETSPGRYAALWKLDARLEPREAEELNRWLTYKIGADPSGWDLTQVLRIPGTTNHKYPRKPKGKLLWYLPTQKLATAKLRKMWGKGGSDLEENEAGIEGTDESGGGPVYQRVKNRLDRALRKLIEAKVATQGKRSEVLWLLQNRLLEAKISPDDILSIISNTVWNKFRGRKDESRQLKRELGKSLGSKLEKDTESGKPEKQPGMRVNGEDREDQPEISAVRMDHVEAEAIEWLWFPYIPIGKITMLEGNPGVGKSWILYTLAAHFSLGQRLPESKNVARVRSLICSVEDHVSDTMKNRLNRLGGDHRWIFATNQPFRLDDEGIEKFERLIEHHKPRVVFFDPLFAYMGGNVDMFRANETREVLSRIQDVAVRHKFAAVCIRHLTKGDRGAAIYRGQGSIDITAAARSVLVVGKDPDDDSLNVFMQIKNNLGPLGAPINFSLEEGKLVWGQKRPDVSASAVMNSEGGNSGGPKLSWVRDWLRNELEGGPRKVSEVELNAEKSSISRMTLRRAREELKVKTERKGTTWYWELPK